MIQVDIYKSIYLQLEKLESIENCGQLRQCIETYRDEEG